MAWIGPEDEVIEALKWARADQSEYGRFIISGAPVELVHRGKRRLAVVSDDTVYFVRRREHSLAAELAAKGMRTSGRILNPSSDFHRQQYRNQINAADAYIELATLRMQTYVSTVEGGRMPAPGSYAEIIRMLSSADCSLRMAKWEAQYGWENKGERKKKIKRADELMRRVLNLSPLDPEPGAARPNPSSLPAHPTNLFLVRIKDTATDKLDPKYLYYLMSHLHSTGWYQQWERGSVQPCIRAKDILDLPLEQQQASRRRRRKAFRKLGDLVTVRSGTLRGITEDELRVNDILIVRVGDCGRPSIVLSTDPLEIREAPKRARNPHRMSSTEDEEGNGWSAQWSGGFTALGNVVDQSGAEGASVSFRLGRVWAAEGKIDSVGNIELASTEVPRAVVKATSKKIRMEAKQARENWRRVTTSLSKDLGRPETVELSTVLKKSVNDLGEFAFVYPDASVVQIWARAQDEKAALKVGKAFRKALIARTKMPPQGAGLHGAVICVVFVNGASQVLPKGISQNPGFDPQVLARATAGR